MIRCDFSSVLSVILVIFICLFVCFALLDSCSRERETLSYRGEKVKGVTLQTQQLDDIQLILRNMFVFLN